MNFRKTEIVIEDIKSLIFSRGYIYSLCMIIFEDFHIILEEIHKVDYKSRLSKNEISFLIGLLIQKKIDLTFPEGPLEVLQLKEKTYKLMDELHKSLNLSFFEKIKNEIEKKADKNENHNEDMRSFFGDENMFTEPIFYANDGAYDFQFVDFLERKYHYDKEWLSEHRGFKIPETKLILQKIKEIKKEKSEQVNFYSLKEKGEDFFKKKNKKNPSKKQIKNLTSALEFYQYVNLFFDSTDNINPQDIDINNVKEKKWMNFYKNLINLFVIQKQDFDENLNIESFLNNFSIDLSEENLNSNLKQIGDYNLFSAKPILQLDKNSFFVPVMFSLYEACYESPYYWMISDKSYQNKLAENRGNAGEEIAYNFLSNVFGFERTYKSVKIVTKKGAIDTDIDILCILGSKALCVQVKSKKLTAFSKKGSFQQLQKDFKGAVQDAYEQGLVSRNKILDRKSKFYDEHGTLITLSEDIDEVYIMGITSENYPSLNHQAHILLEKKDDDPYPIFLTIFDLELVAHYLNNPYDFLYYIKQRTSLLDYFKAESEIIYLGYHIKNKLWKLPDSDLVTLDADFAGLIDRNYIPLRAGIQITDDGDDIKTKWKNEAFELLCKQISQSNEPKVTDVIFTLLDWDGISRENLVINIDKMKRLTLEDNQSHNFSMFCNNDDGNNSGVSYFSWYNDNLQELLDHLLVYSKARKYKSKGDIWIGFGSLKSSSRIIDTMIFNNEKWSFDEKIDKAVNSFLGDTPTQKITNSNIKIGRNDKCSCGSGLKYKKCCG